MGQKHSKSHEKYKPVHDEGPFANKVNNEANNNLSIIDKYTLEECTYDNTPPLELIDVKFWGKSVKIYDGDTAHFAIMINGEPKRIVCRLYQIDAAEIRTKNEKEKEAAQLGKKRLEQLIGNRLTWLHIHKADKYGRCLATLYRSNELDINWENSYNNILISEGLAYFYDGGKRKEFDVWYALN